MKTEIFSPKTLKIGFQERNNTYTGKLAYVTYYDSSNKLRKEKSWEDWRNKDIEPLEIDNLPISGFVLNKKAGGYRSGWNHRQSYIRVYDPRGFEFEITPENLLYILENTNSIKGKGLEGDFVYGWTGTELLLIPTSSPDYEEIIKYSNILQNKEYLRVKDLTLGGTYSNNKSRTVIYLGRHDCFGEYNGESKGKRHIFKVTDGSEYERYQTLSSLGKQIISEISNEPVSDFSDLIDEFNKTRLSSPIDESKDEYIPYSLEGFKENFEERRRLYCYKKDMELVLIERDYFATEEAPIEVKINDENSYHSRITILKENTIEEIFEEIKPLYVNQYLKNGHLYGEKLVYSFH